jgi:hypothetical protein
MLMMVKRVDLESLHNPDDARFSIFVQVRAEIGAM